MNRRRFFPAQMTQTEPGKVVLGIAERILSEAENLKRASAEFATGDTGRLVLAATHTQARYALPIVVRDFVAQHPTVKPLELMRWLVRLVATPGAVILEPFAGSGTTLEACLIEGFDVIGIEREDTYLPLIMQRIRKPLQQSLFGDIA